MNKLTSHKNSSILLLIAFIAALLFALYYYVLQPKHDEVIAKTNHVEQVQQQMSDMKKELIALEERQSELTMDSLIMRQKVPGTRAIEKIILDVVEIEEVTGTRVESLNFNNYDTAVAQSEVSNPNELEKAEAEVNGDNIDTEETIPVSSIVKDSLPDNLKLVTFSVNVVALNFKTLEQFLQEIEQLERVMKIDMINLTIPGEQDLLNAEADVTIKATIQVTTFYYEGEQ
ncbi:hypothetical protein ACIQXI_10335 [Lysinibacillus sp. NPDC097195]|uniref:hypothetical protein n=1 Tax=Lysinibacillus sp. NPDC097195 TaxID=3364141 RepID=UPI003825A41B